MSPLLCPTGTLPPGGTSVTCVQTSCLGLQDKMIRLWLVRTPDSPAGKLSVIGNRMCTCSGNPEIVFSYVWEMENNFTILFLMHVGFCLHVSEHYFPEGSEILKNPEPFNKKKIRGMEITLVNWVCLVITLRSTVLKWEVVPVFRQHVLSTDHILSSLIVQGIQGWIKYSFPLEYHFILTKVEGW